MSDLHSALSSLGPVDFSSVPTDPIELSSYLREHFASAQLLIDSVPSLPPTPASAEPTTRTRSASSASDLYPSSARSQPLNSVHGSFQKEWGKPLKLGAKDNPLGMGVYKLPAKDGRGAWFARRSVHGGLSFSRWRAALLREFQESLEVKGAPGEGNVRGIGGEQRLEREVVEGVGAMEVMHLSAQFPGPTAPRDFVTLLLTSENGLKGEDSVTVPRHFLVLSKPCRHPKTEPPGQAGFTRGSYESVEIIREVPSSPKPKKSASEVDLNELKKGGVTEEERLSKTAVLKRAHEQSKTYDGLGSQGSVPKLTSSEEAKAVAAEAIEREARARGKTIAFAESRGEDAKGEHFDWQGKEGEDEDLPVEWVMLTRSDPGGSVPRFMVERGTPASICNDAVKFLDWACQKELSPDGAPLNPRPSFQDGRRSSYLAGLEGDGQEEDQQMEPLPAYEEAGAGGESGSQRPGVLSNLASAAVAGLETYAPKAVTDRLQGLGAMQTDDTPKHTANLSDDDDDDDTSILSFASAEDHLSDSASASVRSKDSAGASTGADKHLQKLTARKAKLDAQLQKARERQARDKEASSEKEALRLKKAEDKHAREVAKAEERHTKEMKELGDKRERQERKERERREKEEKKNKENRDKREKDELKAEIASLKAERDLLKENVRVLQAENTRLVVTVGNMSGGNKIIEEIKEGAKKDLSRSRSSSEAASKRSG